MCTFLRAKHLHPMGKLHRSRGEHWHTTLRLPLLWLNGAHSRPSRGFLDEDIVVHLDSSCRFDFLYHSLSF